MLLVCTEFIFFGLLYFFCYGFIYFMWRVTLSDDVFSSFRFFCFFPAFSPLVSFAFIFNSTFFAFSFCFRFMHHFYALPFPSLTHHFSLLSAFSCLTYHFYASSISHIWCFPFPLSYATFALPFSAILLRSTRFHYHLRCAPMFTSFLYLPFLAHTFLSLLFCVSSSSIFSLFQPLYFCNSWLLSQIQVSHRPDWLCVLTRMTSVYTCTRCPVHTHTHTHIRSAST